MPELTQPESLLGRDALITAIATFLAGQEPGTLEDIRQTLEAEIDRAGVAKIRGASVTEEQILSEWFPPEPAANGGR